jgi:hypothetical protein
MSHQLHTGDAVRVLPTGEIGLLVAIHRADPESALVSLGAAGLWTFPLEHIGRLDDLGSVMSAGSSVPGQLG